MLIRKIGVVLLLILTGSIGAFAQTTVESSGSGIDASTVLMYIFVIICLVLAIRLVTVMTKNKSLKNEIANSSVFATKVPGDPSGEELAAIAMALHSYQTQMHDHESTVLTINRANHNYSPWSSKIYAMREVPARK